ncbi:hypothetical protein B0T24DRAFT_720802 [Lasiosphaeria ovina]|uniref:Uncharacterized protein n=1 Tax=Lasiosphaeria ovina TaxID=92902 RepID=A0AAE0N847_9PEZI|nr:hypothetical protein B0T24DRAFT_720802 [Lasiosphaeria ovina]
MELVRRKALPMGAYARISPDRNGQDSSNSTNSSTSDSNNNNNNVGNPPSRWRRQPTVERSSFLRLPQRGGSDSVSRHNRLSRSTVGMSLAVNDETSAAVAWMMEQELELEEAARLQHLEAPASASAPAPVPVTLAAAAGPTASNNGDVSAVSEFPTNPARFTVSTMHSPITRSRSQAPQEPQYVSVPVVAPGGGDEPQLEEDHQNSPPLATWRQRWQHPNQQDDPNKRELVHVAAVPIWGEGSPSPPPPPMSEKGARSHRRGTKRPMWNPVWLHRATLLAFAAVFSGLALATGLLYHFSLANHGLSQQNAAYNYSWKYGPTAVLVLLCSLWRLVDLAVKSLMPWHELRQGPADARRTVLLDYLSPIMPGSLWMAFRNRHWPVLVTTGGYILMMLIIIFSSGLLVVEPTEITMDGVSLKASVLDGRNFSGAGSVGLTPASVFYAVSFENLPYPPGTNSQSVVPVFSPTDDVVQRNKLLQAVTASATVSGVRTDFECDSLALDTPKSITVPGTGVSLSAKHFVVNVTHPECKIINALVGQAQSQGDYGADLDTTQNFQGFIQDYVCNSGYDYSGTKNASASPPQAAVENRTAEHRVLITLTDLRDTSTSLASQGGKWDVWAQNITAILCKPTYLVQRYNVVYPGGYAAGRPMRLSAVENTTDSIPGFSQGDLARSVVLSASQLYLGTGGSEYLLDRQVPTFFQMVSKLHGNAALDTFMDPGMLSSSSAKIFNGIGAQLIQERAMAPLSDDTQVTGSVTYTENRLHVKILSTIILCIGFSLLALASIVVLLIRPYDVVLHEPGSVLAVAELLSTNPGLRNVLAGLGARSNSQISGALEHVSFVSRFNKIPDCLIIEPIVGYEMSTKAPESGGSRPIQWWRPLASSDWLFGVAIALPLIYIGILEGLQQLSNQRNGLFDVDPSSPALVLANYIPAGIAVFSSAIYGAMESKTAVLSPFASLRQGNAKASASVSANYLTRSGPQVWIASLMNKHFALSAIIAANFISSFLTVVISGLYHVVEVPYVAPISLRQLDSFDLTKADILNNDCSAGNINNLITYKNLSYPDWTYGELAFPQLNISDADAASFVDGEQGLLSLRANATRAVLNCTSVRLKYTVAGSQVFDFPDKGVATLSTSLPWSLCEHPPKLPNNSAEALWTQQYYMPAGKNASNTIGKGTSLLWINGYEDASSPMYGQVQGDGVTDDYTSLSTAYPDVEINNWGCPTFAVTLGTASVYTAKQKNRTVWEATADVDTMICWQQVQEVTTNLTITYPGLRISDSPDAAPVVDEASARLLANAAEKGPGNIFEYPVNNMIKYLSASNNSTDDSTNNAVASSYYDMNPTNEFIKAMVWGKDGVPLEEITGKANFDRLHAAAQRVYGRYMAQAISQAMRVSNAGGDSTNATKPATTSSSSSSSLTTAPPTSHSTSSTTSYTTTPDASQSSPPDPVPSNTLPGAPDPTSNFLPETSTPPPDTGTDPDPSPDFGGNFGGGGSGGGAAPAPNNNNNPFDFSAGLGGIFPTAGSIGRRADSSPSDTTTPTTTLTGGSARVASRLQQNAGPKIGLQVLLAAMVVGAVAMRVLLRVRDVLPHEPVSIAGVAALVADGGAVGADGRDRGGDAGSSSGLEEVAAGSEGGAGGRLGGSPLWEDQGGQGEGVDVRAPRPLRSRRSAKELTRNTLIFKSGNGYKRDDAEVKREALGNLIRDVLIIKFSNGF